MLTILFIVIIILLLIALTFMIRGKNRFSPIEYIARGKEVGFTFNESSKILSIGKIAGLEDPTNALWSIQDLDVVIKAFAKMSKEDERNRNHIHFMDKLYDFRKKLEFDQPKYQLGIRSSRQIREGQRIKIVIANVGVYMSTVIDNLNQYLVVSSPIGARVPPDFEWRGKKISVYFWQQNDAGYVFDTYVLADLYIKSSPVLQIGHSESLLRTQKRKSLRLQSDTPAYLYLVKRLEGAYEKPERVPGLKCIVQDLSEDGVSVLIGGKAKVGLHVKAQFYINDDLIIMSGTVKGADYNSEKNQSTLHIEAVPPSQKMKNLILSNVYNVK